MNLYLDKSAATFGVVTLETSKILNFKEKQTYFYWTKVGIGLNKDEWAIRHFYNPNFRKDLEHYPSPQMHELAIYLPQHITIDGLKCNLNLHYFTTGIYLQYSFGENIHVPFSVKIIENNYAEAYAKLFLLLKENQYIK